ncbi:MAG: YajQ family cyclic di-GMP-binding protein [Candidatus Margulisiibacteriota bacterium]|jgi:hypothetical protein
MADQHSFDIVSKVDFQEINNAIQQTVKEILTRFDLKDSNTTIDLLEKDNKIHIQSKDEHKLKSAIEILKQKFIKRGISPKAIKENKIESGLSGTAKSDLNIQVGITKENAKVIIAEIKKNNPKLQTQIQDEQIRVITKKIDELQTIIKQLKEKEFEIPLQFINYR